MSEIEGEREEGGGGMQRRMISDKGEEGQNLRERELLRLRGGKAKPTTPSSERTNQQTNETKTDNKTHPIESLVMLPRHPMELAIGKLAVFPHHALAFPLLDSHGNAQPQGMQRRRSLRLLLRYRIGAPDDASTYPRLSYQLRDGRRRRTRPLAGGL